MISTVSYELDEETQPALKSVFRRRKQFFTARAFTRRAEHYIARFSASEEMLRQVLTRQTNRYVAALQKAVSEGGTESWLEDIPEATELTCLIEHEISRCRKLGYIDDLRFATARSVSLHRRGTPLQGIRLKLRQKGITAENIDLALQAVSQEVMDDRGWEFDGTNGAVDEMAVDEMAEALTSTEIDLHAAHQYAKRRRLGPYRTTLRGNQDAQKQFKKDSAALCRAGFSWKIVTQIMQGDHSFMEVDQSDDF